MPVPVRAPAHAASGWFGEARKVHRPPVYRLVQLANNDLPKLQVCVTRSWSCGRWFTARSATTTQPSGAIARGGTDLGVTFSKIAKIASQQDPELFGRALCRRGSRFRPRPLARRP